MDFRRFDFEKLTSCTGEVKRSFTEKLKQWRDYEDRLGRLHLCLSEAEETLTSYTQCNTLEEKEGQCQKYQV